MKVIGKKTVDLAKLQVNLFVREGLDQEHVLYLAELISNKVPMRELIEVVENKDSTFMLVEGRHRKEAYELNDYKTLEVKVLEFDDYAEMVGYAYRANTGGNKPPTPADTEHTILTLINKGVAKKRIPELIGLPDKMVSNYIDKVVSKLNRQKVQRAIDAFSEGKVTMTQAAEAEGVALEKVKEAITRHRRKDRNGIPEIKQRLTDRQKSSTATIRSTFQMMIKDLKEGDINRKQIESIFEQVREHHKQTDRTINNWWARFEALFDGGNEEAKSA